MKLADIEYAGEGYDYFQFHFILNMSRAKYGVNYVETVKKEMKKRRKPTEGKQGEGGS